MSNETAIPNYDRSCCACGRVPTVEVHTDDCDVHKLDLCGPCCWGESAMLDPENWNDE
ncbi:hypothetical protein [Vibrio coralliirubri]|uniref:hypothetical protein n=1 Tax=Vibrio coralliirubri TaxID=1516159 RepID=UPI000AA9B74A|nr:hypothetical protein [Vibrio coralliirubri]